MSLLAEKMLLFCKAFRVGGVFIPAVGTQAATVGSRCVLRESIDCVRVCIHITALSTSEPVLELYWNFECRAV